MKFVIMTGGQGTRLWPASTYSVPKQFQRLIDDKTLFQLNLDSLLTKYDISDIYVSTNEDYVHYVKDQAPNLPEENLIIEPNIKRDSGPASCYAMAHVGSKYPDEVIMFYVQPVVIRTPVEKYIEMIDCIEDLVKRDNKLVTGGIRPHYPDTGSDYLLLADDKVEAKNGMEVYNAKEFVNRLGDYNKTAQLISDNNVSLHANHYTWNFVSFMEALRTYHPQWFEVTSKITEAIKNSAGVEEIKNIYPEFEAGRMEILSEQLFKNNKVQIVILPFKWIHMSTWDDIVEYLKPKETDSKELKVINVDSKNNFVKSKNKKVVALIGVDDLIVVETDDEILISKKNQSNNVKKVLDALDELKG